MRRASRYDNPSDNGSVIFLCVCAIPMSCPTNYCICADWVVYRFCWKLVHTFLSSIFPLDPSGTLFFSADSLSHAESRQRVNKERFSSWADQVFTLTHAIRNITIYYDILPYFMSSYESITHSYQITLPFDIILKISLSGWINAHQ